MTLLGDHVTISRRFSRSANLERDVTTPDPLDRYLVTPRAVDVVQRVATRAASTGGGGGLGRSLDRTAPGSRRWRCCSTARLVKQARSVKEPLNF